MNEPVESSALSLTDQQENHETDQGRVEPASQAELSAERIGFERRLGEMIEREVSRRFQSAKDKRWAQLEKQYGDLRELREMAGALRSSAGESPDQPAKEDGNLEARIRSLADLPGLRGNEDARALILRNIGVQDPTAYMRVMEELIHLTLGTPETETGSGAVSAARAVIPGGSDAPGDLLQAYQRRKRQLRAGDVNALTALKREFRQKGLDVF